MVKGEMSAKTTYQKSAKGPVSIAECSADGKSVTLENVGRKVPIRPTLLLLWPPYVIGGPLYFCPVVSFYLFLSIFFLFFPRLFSAAVDWMSAILLHMAWP